MAVWVNLSPSMIGDYMTSRVRLPRRWPLWGIVIAVVVVILVIAALHGRTTIQNREDSESAATDHCVTAIRDDVRDRLESNGGSGSQAGTAEFSDVKTRTSGLRDAELTALREAGRDRSTVATSWAVTGTVRIEGDLPSGSGLGPNNTFRCTAAVFKDGALLVTGRQIN